MTSTVDPAAELAALESEATGIRQKLDAADLDTPPLALATQGARLDQLEKAIAQRRPAVERLRQEAAQRAAAADRKAFELRQAQAQLDRLLACEDGEVVRMRIDDWRIMIERVRQRVIDLGGTPVELPAQPPIADHILA